jgi:hypothetical protein
MSLTTSPLIFPSDRFDMWRKNKAGKTRAKRPLKVQVIGHVLEHSSPTTDSNR